MDKRSGSMKAWIIHDKKVISFHEVDDAEVYEADAYIFWRHIKLLIYEGYKVQ